jgi:hypothetical protein
VGVPAGEDHQISGGEPPDGPVRQDQLTPAAGEVVHAAQVARCARLGVAHHGIRPTPAGPRLDIPDPDGTVLRFYHFTEPTDEFVGVESRDGEIIGTYRAPRLV